jgi:quinoprotein glucose dehydrogenase
MSFGKLSTKIICVFTALVFLLVYLSCQTNSSASGQHTTWTHYGGSPDQSKYFDAGEITKQNVGQMKLAWIYPTSDSISYFFSPIVVDTFMYVLGKNFSLVALNVLTGKEIWIHANLPGLTRRGINYWESEDKKDRRLIFTLGNSLQAIDALTGQSVLTFGDSGYVDLRQGLERDPSSIRRVQSQMPGVIFDNLVILGSAPGENYFSPPGYVRAFNVVTGKLEWTFHTVPLPGEFGYDTWPKDAYKYVGGANVWSEISVDAERGIAYLPIGSPTYDYYGADREGRNLFGNCLVAVDARTGKRIWHYQTVHHDLWDYDLSAAPQLITVNRNGKKIDAVAIATKHGFMFVFDRVNGNPVFPIEEKPFPASTMPGEKSWATQPVPTLPGFTRHEVTKETLNPYFTDSLKQFWLKRIDSARSGLFIPPSDKYETIMMPGAVGGANFHNTASNPEKGMVYVLTQEYASVYKLDMVRPPEATMSPTDIKKAKEFYISACQTCHGENMVGGLGPSLVNAGQRTFFDDFKNIITNGRGQMPGFTHVDDQTLTALYRYMGGNPARRFPFGRIDTTKKPEGPVVASGGVKMKPDAKRNTPMLEYPEGVAHPENRYTTDYGLQWMGLLTPPWSYMVAYDLNNGSIKWKMPIGEDSLYSKGDKTTGAPNGTQRKGMVVTSTGIVFSTGKGGKIYAFDADNGNILWETTMSHDTNAQPIMYRANGKEYLVVNATANFAKDSYDHSIKPGALPKAYVVYALPDSK